MDPAVLAQHLLNGTMLGVIYALVAVGFTLFFGVLDVIKFSHGDVVMLGAFTALATSTGLAAFDIDSTIVLVLILVSAIAVTALRVTAGTCSAPRSSASTRRWAPAKVM